MKNIISIGLLSIFSLITIYHLLVLLKIISYDNAWGGRLTNDQDMYKFETVSLLLNLIFCVIVAIKANYISINIPTSVINYTLWGMAFLFFVNTIGNLFAKNNLEKMIATPITFLLAVLIVLLLKSK